MSAYKKGEVSEFFSGLIREDKELRTEYVATFSDEVKERVLKLFSKAPWKEWSTKEVAAEAGLSEWEASTYLRMLVVEEKVRVSRKAGRDLFYRPGSRLEGRFLHRVRYE